ncbi:MAG TPA: NAD(P)-binding domain-containing protein, partial [Burkholderiales bacterium]
MARVGIVGGGAFGTALACVVRRSGHEVILWAREPDVAAAINRDAANPVFLPGIALAPGIAATNELAAAAKGADFMLLAPPAQHMRAVTGELRAHLARGAPVVTCSKGVERGTCALMSQVIAETLPGTPVAVLSGPSFAHDIALDSPVGVTLACADRGIGERLAQAIGTPRFRTYLSDDVTGALIGMNLTYDGWLVTATEHGQVVLVSRDLDEHHVISLPGSEAAEAYSEAVAAEGRS